MRRQPSAWLARVQHDLVKRLLWPARDRLSLGGAGARGELRVELIDDEGAPIAARDLWKALLDEAPAELPPEAAAAFARALDGAVAAAAADEAAGVLALEKAFERLSQVLGDRLARNVKDPDHGL